ncbi:MULTISPECIES: hypothetical protein [Crocosphaera]|uniref:Uncharacterized protein n=4 Tax=Crocosphaera watsonii TaxID=263511 RepID=T2JQS7_CROWT|nr:MULTISPECIES: hypothetical protein [Crocosphaera]EHJ11657.1 hypothetical protein CWATWH0003_3605 [Crocosphaera watsonii WH 0003]MCH2246414.1 hypothetical protein [Crocosphaera sp.]NQZ62476.1 hypothetical protein [Crocosphaera sp.]CCQ52581.1 FIG00564470: hypothetical protein [Crocosphaera watsonii WH 8502]CCQ55190.1 hypothetical protein CWATWH0005_54 [Crocosphaera watsonii WH 0005]
MNSNTQQSLDKDQKIAQEALKKAYARETKTLVAEINQKASQITDINDIWALSDYLNSQRYNIEGKYDFGESTSVFVLAQLVKEKWLTLDELSDLTPSTRAKVAALAKM